VLGLHSAIEHAPIDGHVAAVTPSEEALGKVVDVESTAIEQAGQQTEGLSAIIAEGARQDLMRRSKAGRRHEVDFVSGRDLVGGMKFVGDAERVAHQQAEDTSREPLGARQFHARSESLFNREQQSKNDSLTRVERDGVGAPASMSPNVLLLKRPSRLDRVEIGRVRRHVDETHLAGGAGITGR
jgi:hypothetical protein